ncbi:MAG: hypothetical protein HY901_29720 [Deltaproteobacteria bacterium]|nr:hypothetical protein [Deltaproteobacteria bacterium]
MRRVVVCLLLGMAAACDESEPDEPTPYPAPSDAGQPEYTFPGCLNEDGPRCPRSRTAECALDFLSSKTAICVNDEECELIAVSPRCLSVCGPFAVAADDAYETRPRMQAQVDHYCGLGPCAEDPCDAGTGWIPVCHLGFCKAIRPEDAGTDSGVASDATLPDQDAGADPGDADQADVQ